MAEAIELAAVNNGDAYRSNRDAERAVQEAYKEYLRSLMESVREEYAEMRPQLIAALKKRWNKWERQ
jgi:transcription termination factor NusB